MFIENAQQRIKLALLESYNEFSSKFNHDYVHEHIWIDQWISYSYKYATDKSQDDCWEAFKNEPFSPETLNNDWIGDPDIDNTLIQQQYDLFVGKK